MTRILLSFFLITISIIHSENILEEEKKENLQVELENTIIRKLFISKKCSCEKNCVNANCVKARKNYVCHCVPGWTGDFSDTGTDYIFAFFC